MCAIVKPPSSANCGAPSWVDIASRNKGCKQPIVFLVAAKAFSPSIITVAAEPPTTSIATSVKVSTMEKPSTMKKPSIMKMRVSNNFPAYKEITFVKASIKDSYGELVDTDSDSSSSSILDKIPFPNTSTAVPSQSTSTNCHTTLFADSDEDDGGGKLPPAEQKGNCNNDSGRNDSNSDNESSNSIVMDDGRVVFEVEGEVDSDTEDDINVAISDRHYPLYQAGVRNVHFDAEITTNTAQDLIDDIQQINQSINQRDTFVFVKQSNDIFVYGIVESITHYKNGTYVRIKIRADGSVKNILLSTDKFQQYIRQPYSPTKMKRCESLSIILTHISMSQEFAAVGAPNNDTFQFLPDEEHDAHIKRDKTNRKRRLCTVINDNGDVCVIGMVHQEDGQCFCRGHYKKYTCSKNGATQLCDTDIYSKSMSTARTYYDKRMNHYYNSDTYWQIIESRKDPLIKIIVGLIKSEMAIKGYRFICKDSDNCYYVMSDVLIDTKIINGLQRKDTNNGVPDDLKYIDNDALFPSVVCIYSDVDPGTDNVMEKFLLKGVRKNIFSNLQVVRAYDPNTLHHMNEKKANGKYETRWDYKRINWDGDRIMEKVYQEYFAQQVFPDIKEKPLSTCDLPTSVVHIQFKWKGKYFRMPLESCPGKIGAFYQYAFPCDGSNPLRINPEKENLKLIVLSGIYQKVKTQSVLSFKVHRMVLCLWGGPNNSPSELSSALEGDHKTNNKADYCILFLQWLNGMQNRSKQQNKH